MSPTRHIVCPHCHSTNRIPTDRPARAGKCGHCKQPLFVGKPVAVDGSSFARHLGHSDIPLLVDFWAPWCGPCKMMAPVFEQAAAQLEPEVRLLKVNTEEQQQLAGQYNIRSIPTLALFRGGREVERLAGALDLQGLLGWTRQHL